MQNELRCGGCGRRVDLGAVAGRVARYASMLRLATTLNVLAPTVEVLPGLGVDGIYCSGVIYVSPERWRCYKADVVLAHETVHSLIDPEFDRRRWVRESLAEGIALALMATSSRFSALHLRASLGRSRQAAPTPHPDDWYGTNALSVFGSISPIQTGSLDLGLTRERLVRGAISPHSFEGSGGELEATVAALVDRAAPSAAVCDLMWRLSEPGLPKAGGRSLQPRDADSWASVASDVERFEADK